MNRIDCDVAIVGGAMAGSALAACLADSGLQVVVLEGGSVPGGTPAEGFDARVVALNSASQRLLQRTGAWQQLQQTRITPYTDMLVWDADGTGCVPFDAASLGAAALGYIVENSNLVQALYRCLLSQANVQYLSGARVAELHSTEGGKRAQLHLSDCQVSAELVVAADGAQSLLRRLAGIETVEWDYAHHALVSCVQTAQPHGYTARQRFLTGGPLALLPLQDERGDCGWHAIVWSCPPEQAETLLALPDREFQQALGEASEHCLGEIIASGSRARLPLRQRHAKVYYRDRAVLIGDAAHTIHPLAGQGVNLGFADVAALADELVRARARGLDLADPSVLARYQRRRRADNMGMAAAMEGFQWLFGQKAPPLRLLRNVGMRGLSQLPLLKNALVKQAMGLR